MNDELYGGARKPVRKPKRDTIMRSVRSVGDELADIFGKMTVGTKKKTVNRYASIHPREPSMRERKVPARYHTTTTSTQLSPKSKSSASKKSPKTTMSKMRLKYPKYSDDQINALIAAGNSSQARQQVHKLIAEQNKAAKDLASMFSSSMKF